MTRMTTVKRRKASKNGIQSTFVHFISFFFVFSIQKRNHRLFIYLSFRQQFRMLLHSIWPALLCKHTHRRYSQVCTISIIWNLLSEVWICRPKMVHRREMYHNHFQFFAVREMRSSEMKTNVSLKQPRISEDHGDKISEFWCHLSEANEVHTIQRYSPVCHIKQKRQFDMDLCEWS